MLALFYQIFTFANVTFMLKGLAMSVAIAVLATVISMFFGTILALIRTYANGPFQWASALVAVYTEFFRCTPNLLWILWIYFTIKGNKIAVSVFAISLFTSAVMAEIFRGGLNSIPKGQFEAAQSQGFSFLQTLWYIVLPQTYKKVIPALLSQVITTIKDSSYLANVATIELMARIRQLLSAAGTYNGLGTVNVSDVMVLFGAACVIYFIINFTLSCIVRSMQARRKKALVFAPAKAA